MRVLKALGVSLWKEWRDQRAIVVAIFAALPVLTGVAFWAFGDRLIGLPVATQLLIFLPVALGLVFFAVAADLVAGEKRRKTLDFLRRLPGGMTRSFVVKWFFLLALSLAAFAWQAWVLAFAWKVMAWVGADRGYDGARISHEILGHLGVFPTSAFWQLSLVGMVLPPWAFVVSTWLGRSGAAAIASLVVLAGVLAPCAVLVFQHPWLFPFGRGDVPVLAAMLVAVAILVSGVSYLGGLRFRGAVWKPALWGLATALVFSGAGYAYARVELRRWAELDMHDPDLHIRSALVAEGGQKLYLNIGKGPWGTVYQSRFIESATPSQAWVFDVGTGELVRLATDGGRTFSAVDPGANSVWTGLQRLAPHGVVLLWNTDRTGNHEVRWIDAATSETIDTFDDQWTRSPAIDAALREDARRHGFHIDSRGRRVWLRDGLLEREGELPPLPDRVHVVPRELRHWTIRGPFGWTRYRNVVEQGNFIGTRWSSLDAETGEVRDVTAAMRIQRRGVFRPIDRSLAMEVWGAWRFRDLETGADQGIAKNPPRAFLRVVGERRVLTTTRNAEGHEQLRIWNPVSGETWPVTADAGLGDDAIGFDLRGRAPDGRLLIMARYVVDVEVRTWMGVLDPEARTLRTIMSFVKGIRPLVLEDDGALVAIEGNQRIVRLGPAPEQRVVIFPR